MLCEIDWVLLTSQLILKCRRDPEDDVEFCDALYNNGKFLSSLRDALSEDGVMVIQVGGSPETDDPAEKLGPNKNRAILIEHLEKLGFQSMHQYDEVRIYSLYFMVCIVNLTFAMQRRTAGCLYHGIIW